MGSMFDRLLGGGVVLLRGHQGVRSEDDVPLSLPRSKCRFVCWARTA